MRIMFLYKLLLIFLTIDLSVSISTELGIKVKVETCNADQLIFVSRQITNVKSNFACLMWTIYIGNVSNLNAQNFPPMKYKLINEQVKPVSVKKGAGAGASFDVDDAYVCWNRSRSNNFKPGAFKFFTAGRVELTNVCLKHYYTKQLVTCSQSLTTCRSSQADQSENSIVCLEGSLNTKYYEPLQPEFKFEAKDSNGYFLSYEIDDIQFHYQSNCLLTPSMLTKTIDWSYFDQYIVLQMIETGLKSAVAEKWKFECQMDKKCTYHQPNIDNPNFEWFELHNYPSNTSLVMFPENQAKYRDHQSALGFHFMPSTDHSTLTSGPLVLDPQAKKIYISFNYEFSENVSFTICQIHEQTYEVSSCSQLYDQGPEDDLGPSRVNFDPIIKNFRLQLKFFSKKDEGILLLSGFSTNGFTVKTPETEIIRPDPEPVPCDRQQFVSRELAHCISDPTNCDESRGIRTWYFSKEDNECKPNFSCVNVWLHNAFSYKEACENYCLNRYAEYLANKQACKYQG